jgi:predicted GTPase
MGEIGQGKSTTLNALGATLKAGKSIDSLTQNFDLAPSNNPTLKKKNVYLMDSPGLADMDLPLPEWLARYNQKMGEDKFEVSLCVLLITWRARPSTNERYTMAVLAEAFEKLNVENFVVCFNRCPEDFTKDLSK